MYAEAAVDGGPATIWALAPDQSSGSLQVDLGKKAPIGRIIPHWTDAAPVSYQVLTSGAGPIWRFGGRGRWQARSRR